MTHPTDTDEPTGEIPAIEGLIREGCPEPHRRIRGLTPAVAETVNQWKVFTELRDKNHQPIKAHV